MRDSPAVMNTTVHRVAMILCPPRVRPLVPMQQLSITELMFTCLIRHAWLVGSPEVV